MIVITAAAIGLVMMTVIIIINVFVKRKILSIEAILSAYTAVVVVVTLAVVAM